MALYRLHDGEEKGITIGKAKENNNLTDTVRVLEERLSKEGLRERTIYDYVKWYHSFIEYCKEKDIRELEEMNADNIYSWLSGMDIKNTSKNIRLKSLRAGMNRLYDLGIYQVDFWKKVKIKTDSEPKKATTDKDINELLSRLNLSNFFELRDAVSILLMYRTGIRNKTMALLKESNFDFREGILTLEGELMKNRQGLVLPIDTDVIRLTQTLMKQNEVIRNFYQKRNDFIFINRLGDSIHLEGNHSNVIQKRLYKLAKLHNLNVNPHSLRRGFATNLLNEGASVALISKALGHHSLDVTSKYLDIDQKKVLEDLRKYL